jgi:hypothetical protein
MALIGKPLAGAAGRYLDDGPQQLPGVIEPQFASKP